MSECDLSYFLLTWILLTFLSKVLGEAVRVFGIKVCNLWEQSFESGLQNRHHGVELSISSNVDSLELVQLIYLESLFPFINVCCKLVVAYV